MPASPCQTINPSDLQIENSIEFHVSSNWTAKWHAHPEHHELIIVRQGRLQTRIADRILRAQPCDTLVYPLGSYHLPSGCGTEGAVFQAIRWKASETPRGLAKPATVLDRFGRIAQLGEWIQQAWPPVDEDARYLLNLWLAAILAEILQLQRPQSEDWVTQLQRAIRKRLRHSIQLEDLAREAGISKFHLSRRFKAATGLSPMQYVNRVRMEQAKGQLLHTDRPIETIAEDTGFCDASHLSRQFRRLFGESPGSFRKRHAVPVRQNTEIAG